MIVEGMVVVLASTSLLQRDAESSHISGPSLLARCLLCTRTSCSLLYRDHVTRLPGTAIHDRSTDANLLDDSRSANT